MAHIAGAVFVRGAPRAPADPVHILIAFGGVFGKIDSGAEHAADVGVTLVEALVDDGVDEGRTCREGDKARKHAVESLNTSDFVLAPEQISVSECPVEKISIKTQCL